MPSRLVPIYQSSIILNGTEIPCFDWSVDLGTYGQLGRARMRTSVKMLQDNNIDILSLVGDQTYAPLQISFNGELVFGGSYFAGTGTFHDDDFEFMGRDLAAILFDTKRSVADLDINNVTVSRFVQSIADQYGLQAQVQINNDPLIGTVVEQGSVMNTYPQPLWNLLVYLARLTGAEVYTTPEGELVFKTIGSDAGTHNYTWKASPGGPGFSSAANPVMRCTITHQPQRNRNFSVVVISHHQKTTQVHEATVTIMGENLALPGKSKTIPAGSYVGSFGKNVRNLLSTSGLGVPVYTYIEDGLTPDGVQARAQGYANEIAKRLLMYTLVVDGNADIKPLNQLQLEEGEPNSLIGFNAKTLSITGVHHSFSMPQGDGIDEGGYQTTLKAMSVPPATGSNETMNEIFGE